MSTIFNLLKTKNTRGIFWWLKFYHQELLNSIYQRKMSNKIDNSWKSVKISHTVTPKGWNSENAFEFLEKEYNGRIMKGYKN